MSKTKEVVPMSTDELLAAMRELLPAKQEVAVVAAPKVLDFTGFGAVEVSDVPKADRDAVKAAMERIERLEEQIEKADEVFAYGEYRPGVSIDWGRGDKGRRDHYVAAARQAIAEEYEALNLRLTVHARLREHGLI